MRSPPKDTVCVVNNDVSIIQHILKEDIYSARRKPTALLVVNLLMKMPLWLTR